MQTPFQSAVKQLCDEKGLPEEVVMEAIEAALRAAYRKDYGNKDQNIEVDINDSVENATVYVVKTVVEGVEEPELEMTVKDAEKYKKGAKIGDEIRMDVTPAEYGRIAAQSAKQVITQRLQEAERDLMYETFKDRENELLSSTVHRVDGKNVYISLEKVTTLLKPQDQIPGERYYAGQRTRVYLDKVIKTTKGPQLLISRSHPLLVQKLLELEIPEIAEKVVEVKAVAREAGVRSKIAVSSTDDKVDPIGACVGQKGARIQSIMDDLNGERIDIIEWKENLEEFIKAALSPAVIAVINLDKDSRRARIYVHTDQRPLAIGRNGQNVRLASQLVGLELDILDISELSPEDAKDAKLTIEEVEKLPISEGARSALTEASLTQVGQLKGLSVEDFVSVGLSEEQAIEIFEIMKLVK
ncbi:MAG: transcription termination factor NusA [Candidatus Peregrinibacteria bacterium]|nr:transcription termination factor NusA [Candidatus Peregrinibacteria bacterium]MDZ4244709.1 transcription termination factor NusA [Candidatus Gracilibacteria bacterium]